MAGIKEIKDWDEGGKGERKGDEGLGELREILDKCLPLAAYVGSLVRREPLTPKDHVNVLGTLVKIQLLSTKLVIANTYRCVLIISFLLTLYSFINNTISVIYI